MLNYKQIKKTYKSDEIFDKMVLIKIVRMMTLIVIILSNIYFYIHNLVTSCTYYTLFFLIMF